MIKQFKKKDYRGFVIFNIGEKCERRPFIMYLIKQISR